MCGGSYAIGPRVVIKNQAEFRGVAQSQIIALARMIFFFSQLLSKHSLLTLNLERPQRQEVTN